MQKARALFWLAIELTAMNIFHASLRKVNHAESARLILIGHWTDSSVNPITVKQ